MDIINGIIYNYKLEAVFLYIYIQLIEHISVKEAVMCFEWSDIITNVLFRKKNVLFMVFLPVACYHSYVAIIICVELIQSSFHLNTYTI